jgi:hypothetical protein
MLYKVSFALDELLNTVNRLWRLREVEIYNTI